MTDLSPAYHYQVIARALEVIDDAGPALTLDALAQRMNMSPAHFQRVFSQWVGVSPKRYQQYLTLGHARRLLADRHTLLGTALESGLEDLDGFFTFVVGTKNGFGVVRDPIACKPAVMAETDQYVAFGSEYRALVNLPGIEDARVWEPEPATVYFWER